MSKILCPKYNIILYQILQKFWDWKWWSSNQYMDTKWSYQKQAILCNINLDVFIVGLLSNWTIDLLFTVQLLSCQKGWKIPLSINCKTVKNWLIHKISYKLHAYMSRSILVLTGKNLNFREIPGVHDWNHVWTKKIKKNEVTTTMVETWDNK